MKSLVIIVVAIALHSFSPINAQTPVWGKRYDSGYSDSCIDVRLTNTGSFAHIAGVARNGSSRTLITRCFSSAGVEQWTRNGNTNLPGEVLFVKRDYNFNTFLICKNGTSYSLIRYDVNDIEVFRKTLTDRPIGMDIEGTARIYVGFSAAVGFKAECYLSSNGSTYWSKTDHNGMNAKGFALDRNNNVYIGGQRVTTQINPDRRVTKFNAASTPYVWAVDHSNGPGQDDIDLLNVDAAGNVYCDGMGNMFSLSDNRYLTKINSFGVVQWSVISGTIAGFNNVYNPDYIHFDSQQNVYLIGSVYYIQAVVPSNIFYVRKIDKTTGALIYQVSPNFNGNPMDEVFYGYTSDGFDNLYLLGKLKLSSGPNDGYCRMTKISGATGALKWDWLSTNHSVSNVTNSGVISPTGELYLGSTEFSLTVDMTLRKFSQPNNGAKLASGNEEETLEVYPNPFNDVINFSQALKGAKVTLFDMSGRVLQSEIISGTSFQINDDLPPGFYLLSILAEDGSASIQKLIKE